MKVFDIQCSKGHVFEGWFASEEDFQKQRSDALIECPFCGNTKVQKCLSAPRLNSKSNQKSAVIANADKGKKSPAVQAPEAKMQQLWQKAVDEVLSKTEDVGEDFAQEARRIHYGEAPERGIRGQATVQEAVELEEEGIDVVPLGIVPPGSKGPVQ